MLFFNKDSKYHVDKRIFYLKSIPSAEEISKMDFFYSISWTYFESLCYEKKGNMLIMSAVHNEKNRVDNIIGFVSGMQDLNNIEKIEYHVKNEKINIIATVWHEAGAKDEIRIDENGDKKLFHVGYINTVALIEDINTGTKLWSNNGSDDNTDFKINDISFPSKYVIKNGLTLINQLEYDGTITKDIRFIASENDNDNDNTFYQENTQIDSENSESIHICVINCDMSQEQFDANSDECDKAFEWSKKQLVSDKLHSMEISVCIGDTQKSLTITKKEKKYSIGIIDEMDDSVCYYNNGDKSDSYVDFDGETYPSYMVLSDEKLLYTIVDDFIKTGQPSEKAAWIMNE